MSYQAALELTTVVAVALSLVHLAGPRVRRWAEQHTSLLGPISGGALAAYIFLHLLPSLGSGQASYGMAATALVLGGFVTYYTAEALVSDHPHHLFKVKVAIGWFYSFLIVYSLPDLISDSPVAAGVSATALGIHVLQADNRLAITRPESFDRWGRWLLASAPLAAVALDAIMGPPSEQTSAYLSAFTSGVLMLSLFRDELGRPQPARAIPWFLLGLATYGSLLGLGQLLD